MIKYIYLSWKNASKFNILKEEEMASEINGTINTIVSGFLDFGDKVDRTINALIGGVILLFLLLYLLKKIEKRVNLGQFEEYIDRTSFKVIDAVPSSFAKKVLSKILSIEPEIFILLPILSSRNYQHLGYQLNGINRFLSSNTSCKKYTKIVFINNDNEATTKNDIQNLLNLLYKNRRYIFIATMSDIFDTLLQEVGIKIKSDPYYKNMVKIIGTLASQSKKFNDYRSFENIIRLSPPDFDEAKKASTNIFTKLVSSYCPAKGCEFNKPNNIIIIASNAYGAAVKSSFIQIFNEYKSELDASTNYYVKEEDLNRKINIYTYSFKDKKITQDPRTNYTLSDLLIKSNKINSIDYFFIIGYEPNVSNILLELDNEIQKVKNNNAEYSILISATASVKLWQENIKNTIQKLKSIENIEEINYIKIKYPEFKNVEHYKISNDDCKIYTINAENNQKKLNQVSLKELIKDYDIKKILQKDDINYINGFMIMSLELAQKLMKNWDLNLIIEKERLYGNIESKDIVGVKILSSGDSIDHFKIDKLYKKPLESSKSTLFPFTFKPISA